MRAHKTFLLMLAVVALFLFSTPVHAEGDGITVVVNGKTVIWEDIAPRFSKGRVMVPVAKLGEALGAKTVWEPATQDAFLFIYDRYIWLQVTNPNVYYGTYATDDSGTVILTSVQAMPLDPMPDIMYGRMTAPLGVLMDALGGQVIWDGESHTALITGPAYAPAKRYDYTLIENTVYTAAPDAPNAPDTDALPGYFQIITSDMALDKYEADEPMMLVCYDASQTAELREVLRAAADLKMKVYGLDTDENKTALPFMKKQNGNKKAMHMYFITGYERVTTLTVGVSSDNTALRDAMNDYWYAE